MLVRFLIFLFAVFLPMPSFAGYAFGSYWISKDVQNVLAMYPKETARRIAIVTNVEKFNSSCAVFSRVEAPFGAPIADYIQQAFANELDKAQILATDDPDLRVTFRFVNIDFSVPKFVVPGNWSFDLRLEVDGKPPTDFNVKHVVNSFAMTGPDGCDKVAKEFPLALSKVAAEVFQSTEFVQLLTLTQFDIEQRKKLAERMVANKIAAEAEAAERKRLADEAAIKDEAEKKVRAEIAAKELQEKKENYLRSLEGILRLENRASISCQAKEECDRKFALTQIFISENSDMKIQLATDTIIETYGVTDNNKVGAKAIKMPLKGKESVIRLTFFCKPGTRREFELSLCDIQRMAFYEKFISFMK